MLSFNTEAQRRRVLFSRVERVDRVEIFMQASRPQSLIIYSRYSTEGSDTFTHLICCLNLTWCYTEGSDTFGFFV